jgi:hypothetical protein
MAELVTLSADGPLGKAGAQVWVDDPSQAQTPDGWVDPNAKASKKSAPADIPVDPAGQPPAGDQPPPAA